MEANDESKSKLTKIEEVEEVEGSSGERNLRVQDIRGIDSQVSA